MAGSLGCSLQSPSVRFGIVARSKDRSQRRGHTAAPGRSAKFREGPLFLNPTAATGPLLASACEHDHRTPTWDTFVDACRGVIGLRFQPRAVSLQHSPRPPLAQFNYTVCGGCPPRHFLRLRSSCAQDMQFANEHIRTLQETHRADFDEEISVDDAKARLAQLLYLYWTLGHRPPKQGEPPRSTLRSSPGSPRTPSDLFADAEL
jgi:hypothetical protein